MPGDFLSDFLGAEPECRRPAGDKSSQRTHDAIITSL